MSVDNLRSRDRALFRAYCLLAVADLALAACGSLGASSPRDYTLNLGNGVLTVNKPGSWDSGQVYNTLVHNGYTNDSSCPDQIDGSTPKAFATPVAGGRDRYSVRNFLLPSECVNLIPPGSSGTVGLTDWVDTPPAVKAPETKKPKFPWEKTAVGAAALAALAAAGLGTHRLLKRLDEVRKIDRARRRADHTAPPPQPEKPTDPRVQPLRVAAAGYEHAGQPLQATAFRRLATYIENHPGVPEEEAKEILRRIYKSLKTQQSRNAAPILNHRQPTETDTSRLPWRIFDN